MSRTDPALRAARLELLTARAALERAALLDHMHGVRDSSRPTRMVASAATRGMQRLRAARAAGSAGHSGYGAVALRVLLRNPWLIATLLGTLRRGRVLRIGLLAAAAGGAAWWWSRQRQSAQAELPFDVQPGELDDLGI